MNPQTITRWTVLRVLAVMLLVGALSTGCSYSGVQGSIGIGIEASPSNDYTVLTDYGEWADIPSYGRVWRPYDETQSWRPFTNGYWAWTSSGWTWISYEPYGWLVFHYGDWDWDADYGWFWIPGTVWSPARVRWITYGSYVGWAPIGPDGVTWGDPWVTTGFDAWVVVRLGDFDRDDIGRYRLDRPPVFEHRFQRQDFYIPPRLNDVRRHSTRPIPQFNLQRENVRMGNHEYRRIILPQEQRQRVDQYRPQFQRQPGQKGNLRPVPQQRPPQQRQRPPQLTRRGQPMPQHQNHSIQQYHYRQQRNPRQPNLTRPENRPQQQNRGNPQYHAPQQAPERQPQQNQRQNLGQPRNNHRPQMNHGRQQQAQTQHSRRPSFR